MRWFVYIDIDFYPWVEVVEAESEDDARAYARKQRKSDDNVAFYVVPFEPDRAGGRDDRVSAWFNVL